MRGNRLAIVFALALCGAIYGAGVGASEGEVFTCVLDPGHGGSDHGVTGEGGDEKSLALAVARRTEELLAPRQDIAVRLTRSGDYPLSFDERRRIANTAPPGVFLSIHFAKAASREVRGPRVFVLAASTGPPSGLLVPIERAHEPFVSQSRVLAEAIAAAFEEDGAPARVRTSPVPLAPLVGITRPAVLIEFDFLSASDSGRWRHPDTVSAAASVLTRAIDRFRAERKNPSP